MRLKRRPPSGRCRDSRLSNSETWDIDPTPSYTTKIWRRRVRRGLHLHFHPSSGAQYVSGHSISPLLTYTTDWVPPSEVLPTRSIRTTGSLVKSLQSFSRWRVQKIHCLFVSSNSMSQMSEREEDERRFATGGRVEHPTRLNPIFHSTLHGTTNPNIQSFQSHRLDLHESVTLFSPSIVSRSYCPHTLRRTSWTSSSSETPVDGRHVLSPSPPLPLFLKNFKIVIQYLL